uniref:Protein bunched, class 1/class 3/D/E isoforms n=1 Tax=Drosophila melanogaster TaxID=7227 RepID=BUN1_DROME|nr:bunched, isoform B [Drosophila melanogaster]Q24522.2 RecName: Full=Protein bunched, class 1/class 3/D/E isoforms; AltName: Full=Protein shortsighted [Drosophila melanogaster]ACZ94251.1 bunched, isoform B [Drosophila melanogaster]|eukprot:NP_001162965.1 bunched, isoform B [Drosophila melanogaster]
MKTETGSNNNNTTVVNMDFDMYPSISGKQQDPVREVVMKYIDYFLPDASGTSAVAIDNKIEQAMDLVKSHLMIAVREEVEVLKERISELMDKINKLELENSILKSNIPQETLQQLQLQLQLAAPPATPAIQAAPAVQSVVAPAAAGQAVQQQAAGAVAVTGVATSPASAVVPTSIPNGSAENGSSAVESAAVSVEQQVQQVTSAAAAAASVVTANGPMS